jgi:hypothetical protein
MAIVANKAGTDAMVTAKDTSYITPSRTAATAVAVQALTPAFTGEVVVALDSGLTFQAFGPAVNQWQQLSMRS